MNPAKQREEPSGSGPEPEPEPVTVRVTGDLDLHTFRPRDLPELLPAWFGECRAHGIPVVRMIHGKGSGTLRTGVHTLLTRMAAEPDSLVRSWSFPAPEAAGGWGATLVHLI